MKEVWERVKGYEALYEVSNLGKVRCVKNKKLRKLDLTKTGYFQVQLIKGKERKTFFVHRLVADAFLPNPEEQPIVRHKNHNRADNTLSNLEWGTQYENMSDKWSRANNPFSHMSQEHRDEIINFLGFIREIY